MASYDVLSSRLVPADELRAFLSGCFDLAEQELFVGRDEHVLGNVPQDAGFAAFCTYGEVSGHFAMTVELGIENRLADRVGRLGFAERFAARFDAYVLYGDTEPMDLWTVILPDGTRLLAGMEQHDDCFTLYAATAPIPDLPALPVHENLANPW